MDGDAQHYQIVPNLSWCLEKSCAFNSLLWIHHSQSIPAALLLVVTRLNRCVVFFGNLSLFKRVYLNIGVAVKNKHSLAFLE